MSNKTIEEQFNDRVDLYSNKYPLLTREEVAHILKSEITSYMLELSERVKQLEISNRAQQERKETI